MDRGRRGLSAAVLALAAVTLLLAQSASPPLRFPGGDHPELRADWFARFRQSRDGVTPAEHRYRAFLRAQSLPLIQPRRLATDTVDPSNDWTELGPSPETDRQYGALGGRITAIAADLTKDPSGNTVYLGAAYGGLWKSTNAQAARPVFVPIGDNLPSLAIGSIALDPSTSPTTIYVGTGEANQSGDSYYGVGILKSTDAGENWSESGASDLGSFFGTAVAKLLVDPQDPQVLLAAVTDSGDYFARDGRTPVATGLFRSADGGATWTAARLTGISISPMLASDLIYDAVTRTYFAAITGGGIFRSTDQGQTWRPLRSPFGATPVTPQNFYRASLATRGGALFALIADAGGGPTGPADCGGAPSCASLVATGNGGASWTPIPIPAALFGGDRQGDYDQFLAAPAGSSLLVIGGVDAWSTNLTAAAPLTWTNLTQSYGSGSVHADQHALFCIDGRRWIVANDGGAWETGDAGARWSNLNASVRAIQFYSVTPDPLTAGRLLGGSQDNGTMLAAGPTWPLLWAGDGGHTAINPGNPQQLFTENNYVLLQYSNDGGASFHPVVDAQTISDASEFYVPFELVPSNPETMVLATTRVWRGPAAPATSGAGWTPISPELLHPGADAAGDDLTAVAIAPTAPDLIYAAAFDGSISVTHDATTRKGMPAWTVLPTAPGGGSVPVSALAVGPDDPQTLYWGGGEVGPTPLLLKSADGGQSAIDISGNLPGGPINAIVIDPLQPANVYVATDQGVFAANDGGVLNENWARLGGNLPAVAVLDLELTRASGAPVLIAATHGRGAWSLALAPAPALSASPASAPSAVSSPTSPSDFGFVTHTQLGADFAFTAETSALKQTGEIGQTFTVPFQLTANPPAAPPITLDCPKAPRGIACVFSPAKVAALTGTVQGTVTIQIGSDAAPGQHTLELNASVGATVRRLAVTVTVSSPATPNP